MIKIAINLLRLSDSWDETERCIAAILGSDLEEVKLTYTENPHDNSPSLINQLRQRFKGDARLAFCRHGRNIGYAGAHNYFFAKSSCPLLMVLNPAVIVDRSFLGNMVKAFDDPNVAAATGKMLKPSVPGSASRILDGTGIETSRARHARERGQLEPDRGQYDHLSNVFGVSGSAAVYRKSALQAVKLGAEEYFDNDFFAYCEDFDLSWRLRLHGFKCVYVADAVVEHTRTIASCTNGMDETSAHLQHPRDIPLPARQWAWRNHLFAIIKNDFGWSLYRDLARIVCSEFGMLALIAMYPTETLRATPAFLKLLPRMLRKRAIIQSSRTIDEKTALMFFQ